MAKGLGGIDSPVNESQGGTGASNFNTARDNLGLNATINSQTIGYTALTSDRGRLIHYTGAGGVTLALDPAATLLNGWSCIVRNDAALSITINPDAGELINGAATLTLEAGQAITVICDGTGFYTQGQAAVPTGTGANTALSNLAAVAINTSLTSDTDITDDLGSAALRWRNLYVQKIQGAIVYGGIVTTPEIATDQNDYNPPGLATASILKLEANTTDITITGLQGGVAGRILTIYGSNSETITLANGSSSSAAANRFYFPGLDRDFILSSNGDSSVTLIYDGDINNWVLLNNTSTPGINTSGNGGDLSALALASTPAQITSNQDNYVIAVTALGNSPTQIRLSSDASRDITGIAFGTGGRILILCNVGSFNIVLRDQSGSSTAANRFLFGADLTLTPNATATIQYDTTTDRWRLIATTASSGGGISFGNGFYIATIFGR